MLVIDIYALIDNLRSRERPVPAKEHFGIMGSKGPGA